MSVRQASRRNPAVQEHPLAQLDFITVTMEWDEETRSWVTYIPGLLGISTFGKSQEEALDNTREMLLGWLDSMQANKLRIPLTKPQIRQLREALRERA